MNSTLTLELVSTSAKTTKVTAAARRTHSLARTLARKWDMLAVIALMVSSAAYGVFAITQITGF